MKNLDSIIKKHLRMISEGGVSEQENYMFFGNIEQMGRQCDILMREDKNQIDSILKEHDWAQDHIAEAKSLLDQVFDFLMNQTEGNRKDQKSVSVDMSQFSLNEAGSSAQQAAIAINMKKKGIKPKNESYGEIDESKNCPTDPAKWAASKAKAKAKFDVYPSAYANGFAAKDYKSKGGGWKKCTNESVNEEKSSKSYDDYHKTYTSAINTALDYAEKRGYTYDEEEVAREIGMGPRKPSEGNTNRFTISLKKNEKEQKKSLHIQVYGMKENYELNCYIN